MRNHSTKTSSGTANLSRRKAAGISGIALLLMAVLAPIAQFGVLDSLLVPGDASTTVGNIVATPGMFRMAGVAFVIVALLDVVVAWTLHVVFRWVNRVASLVTAWLRTVYGAVLAGATINLFEVARVATHRASLDASRLEAEIMGSVSSFHTGFEQIGLAIFALHLFGLGYLVYRSADFSRFLGILVVVAGAGYLFDSLGHVLTADFGQSVAQFTFVGEALLIFWLFWRAAKGFPADEGPGNARGHQIPQSASVNR